MKKLNWKERIRLAKKRGKFTKKDNYLIGDFNTCIVGEAFPKDEYTDIKSHLIKNLNMDTRKANEIYNLGFESINAIEDNDFKQAQQIYNKIQKLK